MTARIGARICELRLERGLTQEQLAERAGVSRDLIAKLEQGVRDNSTVRTLGRLAGALEVEVPDLLGTRQAETAEIAAEVRALRAEVRALAEAMTRAFRL